VKKEINSIHLNNNSYKEVNFWAGSPGPALVHCAHLQPIIGSASSTAAHAFIDMCSEADLINPAYLSGYLNVS
jgi:hypothetical protein